MAHVIKSILLLVLVVALNGIAGQTFSEQKVSAEDQVYSWQSEQHTQHFDKTGLPYLPDAELGGTGVYTSDWFSTRLQRMSGGHPFFFSKGIADKLAERDAALYKHWGKTSDYSLLSSVTRPTREYYVFALRKIVI